MSIGSLAQAWALPDRSSERVQITLRVGYNDYARLQALKEIFPGRSINDMVSDLVRVGLDELVASLPDHVMTQREFEYQVIDIGFPPDEVRPVGERYGKRLEFDLAYERFLKAKLSDDVKEDSKHEPKAALKVIDGKPEAA